MRNGWWSAVIGSVLAVFAGFMGMAWAKRKIETAAIERERRRQEDHANRTDRRLEKLDAEIDDLSSDAVSRVRAEHDVLEAGLERSLNRAPTPEEIKRLIDESKKW